MKPILTFLTNLLLAPLIALHVTVLSKLCKTGHHHEPIR